MPGFEPSKKAYTPTTSSKRERASRRSAQRNSPKPSWRDLGKKPEHLKQANYSKEPVQSGKPLVSNKPRANKQLVGVDVFLQWNEKNAAKFGEKLEGFNDAGLKLTAVSNRGVKVYPEGFAETFLTDHWCATYKADTKDTPIKHEQIVQLLGRIDQSGLDFIKIENLYTFDGQKGFVAGQGE